MAVEISGKFRQDLALFFVGDDACIVPETPATPQTPGGGRNRPPYIAAINRCQPANASHLPGPTAGR